ncbi:MAG: exopolyphosphatase / guanosine-5-triphosphate,3-diphosphate pyrophosphatase [Nocardioidaceae bacterium]|nr:exopolyphosphatase / guanosine-5-triphosphate,3-diphosphate pyrophosphatase [Nocardioidaceae bacterium]
MRSRSLEQGSVVSGGGAGKRVAALDCGTNTLRLLVADLDLDSGEATYLDRRSTIVRLGQDVDRTGVFADAALGRTFATLDDYQDIIERHHVNRVRFVATSAARDVKNREVFIRGVRERVGVEPEIISGQEEARLTYDGATRQLVNRPDVAQPVLVLDIGGGSTELVMKEDPDGRLLGVSVDVGSVRITERRLHSDPPTEAEVAAAVADVRAALDTVDLPMTSAGSLVGVAGTVTTLGAMVLDLEEYDRERVNLARLPRPDLERAIGRIIAMTVEERRALPFMHPDRADVIGAGAVVLRCVVERVGLSELIVSARDILDGIAWSMA